MRKLLLILSVLFCFAASAQYQNINRPLQYVNTFGYQYERFHSMYLMGLPNDTVAVPALLQNIPFIANKSGSIYNWNITTHVWDLFSSGGSYTDADARAAVQPILDDTAAAIRADFPTGSAANANAGTFYRWLKPSTQEIKTFANGYGFLLDSTTNADAITAILDTATVFPDIRATISGGFGDVGADFVLSNDSLKNNEWVNIVDFGAVGDGTTDATTAIVSAVSTGKDVFIPEGVFLIVGGSNTTAITLNAGQKIFGINRFKSILKTSSQIRIVRVSRFGSVSNLGFLGSGSKTSSVTWQAAIYVSTSDTLFSVTNCYFKNIGGSFTYSGGAIKVAAIESAAQIGGVINNNIIEDCYTGISLSARAEYLNISNNKITNTHVGIWNSAGNTALTNNTFQSCDTAHILFGGTNNGHCVSSSNTYNHNTFNLVVDGVTNGHTFNGDMLYAGDIVIRNSTGIKLLNSDFSTGTITLTNNTNLYRSGRWVSMAKSLVSGEDFTVLGETKTGAGAIPWIDQYSTIDTVRFRGPLVFSSLAGNGVGVAAVDNDGNITWDAGGGSGLSTTDNNLDITSSIISTQKTVQTLTDGATITWDMSAGYNSEVTLGGNRTLDITNIQEGDYGTITVFQDGTGGRTLAVPGGTIALNSAIGDSTVLSFYYDGNSYAWRDGAKTILFRSATWANPTSADNITVIKTDVAITVSKVTAVVVGSSPSVTYQINFASDRSSGSPTTLFSSGEVVTSTTAGDEDTTFADATIPAGSYIWITTSAASGTITEMNVTIKYTND